MTLPTSGPITLGQIATEFGGSQPHSLSEYRGVAGTPGSGPISFSDFYGKSANVAPVAGNQSFTQNNQTTYTWSISLSNYVSDADGDQITAYETSGLVVQSGSLIIQSFNSSTGAITVSATVDDVTDTFSTGSGSFQFRAYDGRVWGNYGQLSFSITRSSDGGGNNNHA